MFMYSVPVCGERSYAVCSFFGPQEVATMSYTISTRVFFAKINLILKSDAFHLKNWFNCAKYAINSIEPHII